MSRAEVAAVNASGEGRPLRVVHVSHTSQPGGAELALARLLSHGRRWEAAVCAPSGGNAFDFLAAQGIDLSGTIPALPTGGTRGRSPLLAARYLAALRRCAQALRGSPQFRAAEVIHANTAAAAIVCALAARRGRAPLVIHLRDVIGPESLGRFGYTAFTRLALPHCDGIISNSRYTAESAIYRVGSRVARAVIQSPSGVTRRVQEPTVNETVTRVGMVGRLQHWKGQHVFIRAFAEVFRGTPVSAYLAGAPLFGETAYETELRELAAALGVAAQVVFLGHVEDVPRFVESVDLLVHASIRPEPLGQSIIQGLAAAKPVIATKGGGPSELITPGVSGLLVAPDQPAALASAMRALADSRELRLRLSTGAASFEGLLTDDESVAAHAEFFRSVHHAAVTRNGSL